MKRHRKLAPLAAALMCLGFAGASHAAAEPSQDPSLSSSDRKFMDEAAIGGMEEVELGKLAQSKASSDEVKQFGQRMADDHGKANEKLKSIASSKGVTLPTELDKKAQGDVDRLAKATSFDREYMDMMVKDHQKDVAQFQKQARTAKDPDLKNFASSTLPTLNQHLKLAQTTDSAVKKTGRQPGTTDATAKAKGTAAGK